MEIRIDRPISADHRVADSALGTASAIAFLVLIAALPWSIAAMSIAAGLCLVLTVAHLARGGRPVWVRSPVDLPGLGWLLALMVAALFAQDRAASLPRIGKGLMPVLVGVAALHTASRRQGERAVVVLLISSTVAALLGWGVWIADGASFAARARGPTGHYMTFAGQLMLAVSLAAGIGLCARDRRWRFAAWGAAIATGLALAGTFTRSAWIGTLVALGLLLAVIRPWWTLVLAVGVLAAFALAPASYRDRMSSAFDPRHPTNVERLYMWEAGVRMLRDHPVTGVGLQDLHVLYDRYRSPASRERVGHLHNVSIQIGATMGGVGLVAFVLLYLGLLRAATDGLRAQLGRGSVSAGVRLGAVAALAGFFVAGLFEWNFGDEELLYYLYTLVGIAWASRVWEKQAGEHRVSPPAGGEVRGR